MRNNPDYLVYQAYGIPEVLNEVMISVASLYKVTPLTEMPKICIYTDSPDYFKTYLPAEITYIKTEKHTWDNWKGAKLFVHRAKIKMLLDFTENYSGSILYCDTDTYFLHSPAPLYQLIREDNYVMHTDEGSLNGSSNKVFQKLESFLKTNRPNGITIRPEIHMWNAGVLGFSSDDRKTLEDVLFLADNLYNLFQKHVMEQLAFSYYFNKKKRFPCDSTVFHYWDFKEYRKTLKLFFIENHNEKFDNWINGVDKILPMELIRKKQDFIKQPYWKRKLMNMLGKDPFLLF